MKKEMTSNEYMNIYVCIEHLNITNFISDNIISYKNITRVNYTCKRSNAIKTFHYKIQ